MKILLPSLKTLLLREQKSQEREYYLALELGKEGIKAAIWEENEKVIVKALAKGKTVAETIEKVKEGKEDLKIEKVIFGLPPYYVQDDKIKPEYLDRLKETAKEFSLSPLGFVVVPEAIAHLLKIEQESPQTAILLGFSRKELTFSLFRGGQSKKIKVLKRTGNVYADLEGGLAKFAKEEVLPSKIILYNESEELAAIKEDLLSYPWQKNERFLHVPKIEILPWDFSIKAVVEAGVSELKQKSVRLVVEEEEPLKPKLKEEDEIKAEDLGFVKDKDVAEEITTQKTESRKQKTEEEKRERKLKLPKVTLPKISLPVFSPLNFNFLKGQAFMLIFIFLIILGGILISSLYLYPKAAIDLIADPQILEKKIETTLNTNIKTPNIEEKEIPGKVYSVKVSGEKTQGTTGKKIIGEPAQGEVTIYNKTTVEKTFDKGSVVFGPNKLKFTLDEEATVASVSDIVTGAPGTKKAKVKAAEIGPEGNLTTHSDFTINNFPLASYAARNETAFSGGTKREITAVSSEDQEKLLKNLIDELKTQAQEELKKQLTPNEEFLEESLKENVLEKIFDKDVGEETDNFTLKLNLEFSQTGFSNEDFNTFLKSYILEKIPPDFEFDQEKSHFKVSQSRVKDDGSVTFTADYKAYLLPKLNLTEFKKEIRGKSIKETEDKVKLLLEKNIIGYKVSFERNLPFLGSKLPLWEQNIKVKIIPY